MARVQVITGVEPRRRWSQEQKRALVAADTPEPFTPFELGMKKTSQPGRIGWK